ncbi:unnamed protein product [Toxocara canis]|uniref:Transcriptional regulator n=1 Tax=Toxocara canis TaxID=6265 RepID=A0A183V045_TOXCA|nr:unnamed protein product [Toxocara canis]
MILLSNVVAPSEGIRISQPQVAAFIETERCGEERGLLKRRK